MKNCTIIIPHKDKDKDRTENLFTILEWIDELDFVEKVLIIESDNTPIIQEDIESIAQDFKNYDLEYHFLYTDKPFNRSWICNYGATQSNNKNLFFLDNDIFINPKELNELYMRNDYKKMIKPYNLYKALSVKKSNDIRKNLDFTSKIDDGDITLTISRITAGGMLIINRDFFFEIKGWNESFVGWGYEDNEMKDRIESKMSFKAEELVVYHLYHKQETLTGGNINPYIYQQTVKDGPNKYINNTNSGSIGKKENSL